VEGMTIWAKRRHVTTEARSEWNNTKLNRSIEKRVAITVCSPQEPISFSTVSSKPPRYMELYSSKYAKEDM